MLWVSLISYGSLFMQHPQYPTHLTAEHFIARHSNFIFEDQCRAKQLKHDEETFWKEWHYERDMEEEVLRSYLYHHDANGNFRAAEFNRWLCTHDLAMIETYKERKAGIPKGVETCRRETERLVASGKADMFKEQVKEAERKKRMMAFLKRDGNGEEHGAPQWVPLAAVEPEAAAREVGSQPTEVPPPGTGTPELASGRDVQVPNGVTEGDSEPPRSPSPFYHLPADLLEECSEPAGDTSSPGTATAQAPAIYVQSQRCYEDRWARRAWEPLIEDMLRNMVLV